MTGKRSLIQGILVAAGPGAPKISYLRYLGSIGLPSSRLVSEYGMRWSEPNTLRNFETAKPPPAITIRMTSGIHNRLRVSRVRAPRRRGDRSGEGWRTDRRSKRRRSGRSARWA